MANRELIATLDYEDGKSQQEIADQMGVSPAERML